MHNSRRLGFVLVPVLAAFVSQSKSARAEPEFFDRGYLPNYVNTCQTCHVIEPVRNEFGMAVEATLRGNGNVPDWDVLCEQDTDGDGQSNGDELGDPCCTWTMGAMPDFSDMALLSHPSDAGSVNTLNCDSGMPSDGSSPSGGGGMAGTGAGGAPGAGGADPGSGGTAMVGAGGAAMAGQAGMTATGSGGMANTVGAGGAAAGGAAAGGAPAGGAPTSSIGAGGSAMAGSPSAAGGTPGSTMTATTDPVMVAAGSTAAPTTTPAAGGAGGSTAVQATPPTTMVVWTEAGYRESSAEDYGNGGGLTCAYSAAHSGSFHLGRLVLAVFSAFATALLFRVRRRRAA